MSASAVCGEDSGASGAVGEMVGERCRFRIAAYSVGDLALPLSRSGALKRLSGMSGVSGSGRGFGSVGWVLSPPGCPYPWLAGFVGGECSAAPRVL